MPRIGCAEDYVNSQDHIQHFIGCGKSLLTPGIKPLVNRPKVKHKYSSPDSHGLTIGQRLMFNDSANHVHGKRLIILHT